MSNEEIESLQQRIKLLSEEIEFRKRKAKERDIALAAFGRAANALVFGGEKYKDAVELFIDSYLAGLNEYKLSLEDAKEATKEALSESKQEV